MWKPPSRWACFQAHSLSPTALTCWFTALSVTEVITHHLTHFCKILLISRTTLGMKRSHLLLLLQLEKKYKEALFTSWARQSEPSSISTAAARRVFTKPSRCTKVSMGLASSTEDVNHRCPLPQPLVWGQALQDLKLSICITSARAPPREHFAVTKTPAKSTYCPCRLQADTAGKGNPSNSNPPEKKLHRNPIQAAQSSLRVQLHTGTSVGLWITVWLLQEEEICCS